MPFCVYYDDENCLANLAEESDKPLTEAVVAQIALARDYLRGDLDEFQYRVVSLGAAFHVAGLSLEQTGAMMNGAKMVSLTDLLSRMSNDDIIHLVTDGKAGTVLPDGEIVKGNK